MALAQRVGDRLMTNQKLHIIAICFLATAQAALAASETEVRTEGSYVRFQGDKRFDDMFATSLIASGEVFGEPGAGNITQMTASGTFIRSAAPSKTPGFETNSLERRASLGLSQTFSQLTSIGLNAGFTSQSNNESKNSFSRWYSLRLSQWWNKATLLTELEVMRNDSRVPIIDYLDTDGRRVLTPNRIEGNRYSLNVTWLASPQAMLMASLTKIYSDNRPEAISGNLEGRYFITATSSAIHLKTAAYEDSSQVRQDTDYGRISARELEAQFHQHLSDHFIAAIVLRDHLETEKPRSLESDTVKRHSKMTQGRLRYRFVTGPVTEMVPELYIFFGQYNSLDSDTKINHVGMGGSYVL